MCPKFLKDRRAFIFSLISNEYHAPLGLLAQEDAGVYISQHRGPAFGRFHEHCGFIPDFEIAEKTGFWSEAKHTKGYGGYPDGHKNDRFLAGASKFTALELEVFWLDNDS